MFNNINIFHYNIAIISARGYAFNSYDHNHKGYTANRCPIS